MPPGGHLEEGELPSEGAIREALEETGLRVEILRDDPIEIEVEQARSFPRPYLCLVEDLPDHQHIDFVYLGEPVGGELKEGWRWMDLEAIEAEREIFEDVAHIAKRALMAFEGSMPF